MEENKKDKLFCSLEKDKIAIKSSAFYGLNLCKECLNIHSKFLPSHQLITFENDKDTLNYTIYCSQKNHNNMNLNYYCEAHNQFCCALCHCLKKDNNYGIHSNCKIISIKEIENTKKQNLNINMQKLDELIKKINEKKEIISNLLDKNLKNKEETKKNVSTYFTKLRSIINEREDKLNEIIEEKFNIETNMNEEIKIFYKKSSLLLKLGNEINNNWDENNKSIETIQKCIDIEKMNETINNYLKIVEEKEESIISYYFYPNVKENFLDKLKNLGNISKPFSFKLCPKDLNSYQVLCPDRNILKKIDTQNVGAIIDTPLEKNSITKWTFKFLNSKIPHVCLGVAPYDYDLYMKNPYSFGWTLHICSNVESPTLYSGQPHSYDGKSTSLSCYDYNKCDEVGLIMDTNKGELYFILNNEKPIKGFSNIPLDKPLSPVVYFDHINESLEIKLNYSYKKENN